MITARELRSHFSTRRTPNYFAIAVDAARQHAAALAPTVVLERLTISLDVMPHHYIARAVILDLQPSALVEALATVQAEIRETYPHAQQTGWRAASDGLTVYFYCWTPSVAAAA